LKGWSRGTSSIERGRVVGLNLHREEAKSGSTNCLNEVGGKGQEENRLKGVEGKGKLLPVKKTSLRREFRGKREKREQTCHGPREKLRRGGAVLKS